MKSPQAQQYVSALEASFGTYSMYLWIVSLKPESLSPKYDAYTFRDLLETAVSTRSQFSYAPLSSKEYGESISLTRSTASIITVRKEGKHNNNNNREGTKHDIVTTGDGELTNMITENNNKCIQHLLYTRYNNERKKIDHHSNNKPIKTSKRNCDPLSEEALKLLLRVTSILKISLVDLLDLNAHKLVYRGVTCNMDFGYETSMWPTACPRLSFVMNRRMCYVKAQ